MAIFYDPDNPSIEDVVSHPAVLRFLNFLLTVTPCATTSQSREVLRDAKPPEMGAHKFHALARSVLFHLEIAEYLESVTIKRFPPLTIGVAPKLQVFYERSDKPRQTLTPEEQVAITFGDVPEFRFQEITSDLPMTDELLEIAKRRVPPIEAHKEAKLYIATEKAESLVRPSGFGSEVGGQKSRAAFIAMAIEDHQKTARGDDASPHEIAGTRLTAVVNLTQVLLWERFRTIRVIDTGEISFAKSNGNIRVGNKLIALAFLRPLRRQQIEEVVRENASACDTMWWL